MIPIRNSVKAIITRDGALLLIRKQDELGDYYIFPGGGQDKFEPMPATLRRECMEEIGVEVEVGELRCIREYIGRNHDLTPADADVHQVEFYFSCVIPGGQMPVNGSGADEGQLGVEWIPLANLASTRVYPGFLRGEHPNPSKVYWGDVN